MSPIQSNSGAIVITGAAGFIGSNIVLRLLADGVDASRLVLVDDLDAFQTRLCAKTFKHSAAQQFGIEQFPQWLASRKPGEVTAIHHMGASSSTEEFRVDYLKEINTDYTARLWDLATEKAIPFVYASSAATYGDGRAGFSDDPLKIPSLRPLNPYGQSKQNFDLIALERIKAKKTPPLWAGFKFFNVYGPGEDHKGSQANVVFHATNQVLDSGTIRLFKSHHPDYQDGEQKRDFVYVGDAVDACLAFSRERLRSGIYNLGTGKARTFLDLARGVFAATRKAEKIEFIPTPERLRPAYQYFTQADLGHLREAGYQRPMTDLESGIATYLQKEETWKGRL